MNKDYWLDYIEKDPKYPKRALILDMWDTFEKEKLELEELLKESELKLVQANSVIANLNDNYKLLEKEYDTLELFTRNSIYEALNLKMKLKTLKENNEK